MVDARVRLVRGRRNIDSTMPSSKSKSKQLLPPSVRENKYGLTPKPAVPRAVVPPPRSIDSGGGGGGGGFAASPNSRMTTNMVAMPGGPTPNKAKWFKGKRVVKPHLDKRSFQRRPTDVPKRLVGRGLEQERDRRDREFRDKVTRSNNFDPASFDFVASIGTPNFARVVLHQTAPAQRTLRNATVDLQSKMNAIEDRLGAAEQFAGVFARAADLGHGPPLGPRSVHSAGGRSAGGGGGDSLSLIHI